MCNSALCTFCKCCYILCIIPIFLGMKYAVTEIKLVLYTLVKSYEFCLEPNDNAPSSPNGMLFYSENNAKIRIKRL